MDMPDGWTLEGNCLTRSYRFHDFAEAFAFLTQVALHAERVNHHPDFCCRWNMVEFRLSTHSAARVTDKDLALAAAIDRLSRT